MAVARTFHAYVRVKLSGELSGVGLYCESDAPMMSDASRETNPWNHRFWLADASIFAIIRLVRSSVLPGPSNPYCRYS